MSKKLFLIDGFGLVFRAYYAFINRPLINSKGENTSAVFGFFRMVFKILKIYHPENLIIVFDSKGKNFRHEIFPEYKANRDKTPEDLLKQIPWIIDLVNMLGLPNTLLPGYEADDIIAAYSDYCTQNKYQCRIFSGDKDLLQLINKNVKVLMNKYGTDDIIAFTDKEVQEKFGVPSKNIADYLAIVGDASDNVPGVKGIGKKGAEKLINEYGSLSEIYKNVDNIKPDGIRKKLLDDRDNAELSYSLVLLNQKIDLPLLENEWQFAKLKTDEAVARMLELELNTLVKDPLLSADYDEGNKETEKNKKEIKCNYRLISSDKDLDKLIDNLKQKKLISIDTETTSLDPYNAELLGISFSYKELEGFYVPLGHDNNPLDFDKTLNKIKPILEDKDINKTGQNLKYEYSIFRLQGIRLEGVVYDTMISAYLIDPGKRCNLDELAKRYLDREVISYKDLVKEKEQTLFDVDLEKVAEYASEDAEVAYTLTKKTKPILKEKKLLKLFEDIEMPLVEVLSSMETNGIMLDVKQMNSLSKKIEKKLTKLIEEIYVEADEEFNINSPKQLSSILFDKMGIEPIKKTKTGYSTNEEVLQELAVNHKIAVLILEYRKLFKIKNTYVDVLPTMINEKTDRIHTNFNQAVTTTGRLSSSDPNLQNIPIKDELGREVRAGFIPDKGNILISADYSQIELRILAALSKDEELSNAYLEGLDIHTRTASSIFDVDPEKVDFKMRNFGKTINFGVVYGLSAFGLSKDLGVSRSEAKNFIDSYFTLYSGVKDFINNTILQVEKDGFIRTWFGRVRMVPEIFSKNKMTRNFGERLAVNTYIQGTAADLIKISMNNIFYRFEQEKLNGKLLLQVHDELLFEVSENERELYTKIIDEEMKKSWPFKIPIEVSIGHGKSWEEAH